MSKEGIYKQALTLWSIAVTNCNLLLLDHSMRDIDPENPSLLDQKFRQRRAGEMVSYAAIFREDYEGGPNFDELCESLKGVNDLAARIFEEGE